MDNKHKTGPCLEKGCAWCCDPVKLPVSFPESRIPKDSEGEPIWTKTGEHLLPEGGEGRDLIKTYTCKEFDPETKQCGIYNERPEICRNTSCVNPDSAKSTDEQHKEVIEQKFFKIPKR